MVRIEALVCVVYSVQSAVSLQFVICRGKGSGREGLDKRLGRRFIGFAYSGRN